jgi:putative ABC transport system permease protein
MIGLALIVFVTVFAAGINSSVAKTIDDNFRGEIVLANTDGFSPFPREALDVARGVDGVQTVSAITYATGKPTSGGGNIQLAAVDPATLGQVLALDFQSGNPAAFAGLPPNGTILDENFAKDKGLKIGDTLRVRTPTEQIASFRVLGTVKGELDLLGKALIDESATSKFGRLQPNFALARLTPSASPADTQKAIENALKNRYPTVEVQNQSQLKDQQKQQVNQLLGLIYALLSLAIVVSVFGIVNTLALSIHERTRELGMLRAVGMSRRQVRTMVRYEAVITALIGAILGTVLGVVFAALVSRPLADDGFRLSYPIATLLVLLVLAAIAGVIAAIGPARRASRLDVLRALAYE